MNSFALEVKNLVKRYGGTLAVDNISFNVAKGEFFGFLGPNGAGKTSTIHSICGIGNFQGGEIKIFGHDVKKDYRQVRKKIGLSPQEFNAETFRPVWAMLDYVGGYFGMRKKERKERTEYLFNMLGLGPYAKKTFRELSGGFKRRAMLARALMHDPELLILDEPTAGVDVELRHELWRILRELNKAGKTIFLTTHYLEEAEKLCGRIAIIFGGKIVMMDSKNELIKEGKTIEEHYLSHTQQARNNKLKNNQFLPTI